MLRILFLLLVLLAVAVATWRDRVRSTQWRVPLYVAIYPIAADDSPVTAGYIKTLNSTRFTDIDRFFAREARRYGVGQEVPIKTRLQAPLHGRPPTRDANAGLFGTMLWSLKLRYWAARVTRAATDPADIRIFVLFHDPALINHVPHSLGLQKGLIGVVYAFATGEMDGGNSMVIAHEMMHTLGATDKYEAGSNAPIFPQGYGDPSQNPLYPQRTAELMGGRRMLSPTAWEQPTDLNEVVIGPASALEIRWGSRAD